MRRIDPVDSTLTRSLDMIYEIDDADMQTSGSSEFPQKLFEAYADVFDANQERNKRRMGPISDEDESRVVPMKRKLYSPSEIKKAIALENLGLMALLHRSPAHS